MVKQNKYTTYNLINKKLRGALHEATAMVEPLTDGANVDTILVYDILKCSDL